VTKLVAIVAVLAACDLKKEPAPRTHAEPGSGSGSGSAAPAPPPMPVTKSYDALPRADFNRWAVRENLPVYWIEDANKDGKIQPGEVASLMFYPTTGQWTTGGAFTKDFDAAYDRVVAASKAAPADERQKLVGEDLDQGRPTLVANDLTSLSADDKAFVGHMLKIGQMMDRLYETQSGAAALAEQLPADAASKSMFRRNRGVKCVAPLTATQAACSAIAGATQIVSVYPATIAGHQQSQKEFCDAIERAKNKDALMAPFTVVRQAGAELVTEPYSVAYKDQMTAVADELVAAAASVKDPNEKALVAYLTAAAQSFRTNDWLPSDEAWAKMSVDNSKWYVRVAPDETYWEPCAHKAGFHLTFARINQGSIVWQKKLAPIQQDMEAAIAAKAGAPYAARKVAFHLPDFIDIVVNAGNDRDPLGATVGESLPNWGPVANGGHGRTIVMVNFYTDADSQDARRAQAESMFDAASAKLYAGKPEPGLLGTILHEATHNLGPAHEYTVGGKKDGEVFGGPTSSMMEELKAQTGALFLIDMLRTKKLIDADLAAQAYTDAIVWAFGQISQGVGPSKAYGSLAAIQIGILVDKGALTWDANAIAANGKDKGAFHIHTDKLAAVADDMMKLVAGIKARGDAKAANDLIKRYVDASTVVPHAIIAERLLRFPKASFVYSLSM
jgi:hypothetical protein